jgi:hypothetical protein
LGCDRTDIVRTVRLVRFVPKAGVARAQQRRENGVTDFDRLHSKRLPAKGSSEELLLGIGGVEIRLVHRLMAALV